MYEPSFPPRSRMQNLQSLACGQPSVTQVKKQGMTTQISPIFLGDEDLDDMIERFFTQDVDESIMDHGDSNIDTKDKTLQKSSKQAWTPLFTGSKTSVLRTCLSILNLQTIYGWSDASVNALLSLLKSTILPKINKLSTSRDVAKSILTDIGMDYKSIHACPNDYILYRGDYVAMQSCPKCHATWYRRDCTGTKVPVKVLRHFPIIPWISHMFECPKITKLMTWHAIG